MRTFFTGVITALLVGTGSAALGQISIGVQIGQPPPPRVYVVPARPGPEFVWVEGYWFPQGRHYAWHDGYWTRPPSVGAYWVEPYYEHGRYVAGYWESPRGRFEHDHRWDREQERRDERRERREDRH